MSTKTNERRVRFPAAHEDSCEEPIAIVLEVEVETPCSETIVMSQARELPALQESLRERGMRTIH